MAMFGAQYMPKFENKWTIGNILTILTMVIGGIAAWYALSQTVAVSARDIDNLDAKLTPVVTTVDALETRMAVVERNQQTGKEQREAFQDEAKQTLELLRQQNVTILQQLSAITARLDAQDRAGGL